MHECDRKQSDIVVIQGDTYQKNVSIEGVFLESIESVYFSCGKLNLEKELYYDESINKFVLLLTSEETKNLKPIVTDFDITVKIIGKVITGLYRGKFIVAEKNNRVEAY